MAAFVLTDAEIVINAVDLSDHVQSATLNYAAEMVDQSVMGDLTRTNLAGLKVWSLDVTFKQDFASGSVDATLFTLVGAAAFTVTFMSNKTDGIGVTNPRFSGSAVLETYPPIAGGIGELSVVTASFQAAGILSRLTA